jgi:hypothetical protein
MITNPDGSAYNVIGTRQQFDDRNPEHDLFNQWDQEAIRIGGSPIFYYECFIQPQTIDPIYLEDRGKIFSSHPIQLYGLYEPIPSQNLQTAFGIDSPDEMVFEFNYRALLDAIGHKPKIGSRLHTPFLQEDWVIIENKLGEFKLWQALRMQVLCQRYQDDLVTGAGRTPQKKADYKIM